MLIAIAIVVFSAVLVFVLVVFYIVRARLSWQMRSTKERVERLSGQEQESENVSLLMREEKLSEIPLMNRLLRKFAFGEHLKKLIKQAGLATNPGTIILSMLCLASLAFLVMQYTTHSYLLALTIMPVAGLLPYLYLRHKRNQRVQRFEELLPEALDMVVNSLRAGFTFELAMKMVAQEIPDPVGLEFAIVFEEQNLGVPLVDALAGLRERNPSNDLDLLVVALLIHRRIGGNLAEILEKTSATIRDRFRLKREIKTKTAHGRFSGFVLVLMPLVMVAIILTLNPDYFMVLIKERTGEYLLATAVVMQIIGILVIRRIINIEI